MTKMQRTRKRGVTRRRRRQTTSQPRCPLGSMMPLPPWSRRELPRRWTERTKVTLYPRRVLLLPRGSRPQLLETCPRARSGERGRRRRNPVRRTHQSAPCAKISRARRRHGEGQTRFKHMAGGAGHEQQVPARPGQCVVSGRGIRDGFDAGKTGAGQRTAARRSSRRHTAGNTADGTGAGPKCSKEGQRANRHKAARRSSGRQLAARSGGGQAGASQEAARAGGAAERPWR